MKHLKRYLLFNAGCTSCTQLAQRIEQASGEWLQARSIRDQEMQTYLKQAGHQPNFEPTLVEVTEKRVQVFTGWTLRRKLLLGLGPRRMWHILLLANNQQHPALQPGRRRLITWGSALVAGLALGLGWQKSLHAFASSAFQETPLYQHTLLSASEARQLFEEHPLLQQAVPQFGSVDWAGVTRFIHRETQEHSYGLPLVSKSNTLSLLMLGEMGNEALISSKGLVLQAHAEENKRITFQLFLPSGQHGISFMFDQGKMVESPLKADTPNIGWVCIASCIAMEAAQGNISEGCSQNCYNCGTTSGVVARSIYCSLCLKCAGPKIYNCFKQCYYL